MNIEIPKGNVAWGNEFDWTSNNFIASQDWRIRSSHLGSLNSLYRYWPTKWQTQTSLCLSRSLLFSLPVALSLSRSAHSSRSVFFVPAAKRHEQVHQLAQVHTTNRVGWSDSQGQSSTRITNGKFTCKRDFVTATSLITNVNTTILLHNSLALIE